MLSGLFTRLCQPRLCNSPNERANPEERLRQTHAVTGAAPTAKTLESGENPEAAERA